MTAERQTLAETPDRQRPRRWAFGLLAIVAVAVAAAAVIVLTGGSGGSGASPSTGEDIRSATLPTPNDLPTQTVALVGDVPTALGTVTRGDLGRAMAQSAAQAGLGRPPAPGGRKYKEIEEGALRELLDAIWIRGQAKALGIAATPAQVRGELAQIKEQSFKDAKEFREFLKEDDYTEEDVNERVELQILSAKLEEKITAESPAVTPSEIEDYYEAEKDTKFTHDPTRDVRVITSEVKEKVEAARQALEANSSVAGWREATKAYSPTTAAEAGLQKEISEEFLTEPLRKDIFQAAPGELIGPLKQEDNYLLVEVVRLNPGKASSLDEVRSQIRKQLDQEATEERFARFVDSFDKRWRARTVCARRYAIESCSNGPRPTKPPSLGNDAAGVGPGT